MMNAGANAEADSHIKNTKVFTIAGEPKALARPIISCRRGPVRLVDPNRHAKSLFRAGLKREVFGNSNPPHRPLYPEGPVCVAIIFRMRRPNDHFINNSKGGRLVDRLKTAAHFLWPRVPDVDNLGKFVLDAANKILFSDDSQVLRLTLQKIYDIQDSCSGSTEIHIRGMSQQEVWITTKNATTEFCHM